MIRSKMHTPRPRKQPRESVRAKRVLIIHNDPILPPGHPDATSEHEILIAVDYVDKALARAGFEVTRLALHHDIGALITQLQAERPDAVFNLFEGHADFASSEDVVAGILEWLEIPFTGSPSSALCMARNKHRVKTLLRGANLPTAEAFVADHLPITSCPISWPVIVKPAAQDASVGLDQGSVVTDLESLNQRVDFLMQQYGPPVLVEEFIAGRELNVALIERPDLQILPISEIQFLDKEPGFWPIVTYDAKWTPGSRDFESTPPLYPTRVAPRLKKMLETMAREAFHLIGCRDYARVDFRVRAGSKPYILEVNPNPDFSPSAGLASGLKCAGIDPADFTVDLVRRALERGGRPAAHPPAAIAVQ